ncbi:MAG TPA: hypothetical protein VGC42_18560, partial [Kofleriaceae bacterium]
RLFYGETDYQTVELVRQARVPSVAALNPEVEPELEQVVRKSLARDPDERYQSAADLGDALAQFLFSHRMKVTARDIAAIVRDAQVEMMRKRSAEPKKDSLIDALILDEMQKMTSLIGGNGAQQAQTSEGSLSLDPSAFINTSDWASEMNMSGGAQPQRGQPGQPGQGGQPGQAHQGGQPARPPARPPKLPAASAAQPEVESLEAILEPDRTGVHKNDKGNKTPWLLIAIIMLVLAAGAAVGVMFLMK